MNGSMRNSADAMNNGPRKDDAFAKYAANARARNAAPSACTIFPIFSANDAPTNESEKRNSVFSPKPMKKSRNEIANDQNNT